MSVRFLRDNMTEEHCLRNSGQKDTKHNIGEVLMRAHDRKVLPEEFRTEGHKA